MDKSISSHAKHFPPGPESFTDVLKSMRQNEAGALLNLTEQYGDIVHYHIGASSYYLINHPTWIEYALELHGGNFSRDTRQSRIQSWVFDTDINCADDSFWERQRNLIAPLMADENFLATQIHLGKLITNHISQWQAEGRDNHFCLSPNVDVLVAEVLFRFFIGDGDKLLYQKLARLLVSLDGELFRRSQLLFPLPPLQKLPRDYWLLQCSKNLRDLIGEAIDLQTRGSKSLFLTSLLAAHDEATRSPLRKAEVVNIVLSLFEAAFSATGSLLEFCLLILCQQPQQFHRLQQLLLVSNNEEGAASSAQASELKSFVNEVLRLYPPKVLITRRVLETIEIGNFELASGAVMCISPYALQRRADVWPQPDLFMPQRFDLHAPSRYQFMPFGLGLHKCLGERFVYQVAEEFVRQLVRHFNSLAAEPLDLMVHSGWTLQVKERQKQEIIYHNG